MLLQASFDSSSNAVQEPRKQNITHTGDFKLKAGKRVTSAKNLNFYATRQDDFISTERNQLNHYMIKTNSIPITTMTCFRDKFTPRQQVGLEMVKYTQSDAVNNQGESKSKLQSVKMSDYFMRNNTQQKDLEKLRKEPVVNPNYRLGSSQYNRKDLRKKANQDQQTPGMNLIVNPFKKIVKAPDFESHKIKSVDNKVSRVSVNYSLGKKNSYEDPYLAWDPLKSFDKNHKINMMRLGVKLVQASNIKR